MIPRKLAIEALLLSVICSDLFYFFCTSKQTLCSSTDIAIIWGICGYLFSTVYAISYKQNWKRIIDLSFNQLLAENQLLFSCTLICLSVQVYLSFFWMYQEWTFYLAISGVSLFSQLWLKAMLIETTPRTGRANTQEQLE